MFISGDVDPILPTLFVRYIGEQFCNVRRGWSKLKNYIKSPSDFCYHFTNWSVLSVLVLSGGSNTARPDGAFLFVV
jgi:hypothetical protein